MTDATDLVSRGLLDSKLYELGPKGPAVWRFQSVTSRSLNQIGCSIAPLGAGRRSMRSELRHRLEAMHVTLTRRRFLPQRQENRAESTRRPSNAKHMPSFSLGGPSGPALRTDPGVKPGRKTYYGAAWVRACCIAFDTALSRSAGKMISSFSPPCLACTRSSRTPNRS
jgi:hypothetical protein